MKAHVYAEGTVRASAAPLSMEASERVAKPSIQTTFQTYSGVRQYRQGNSVWLPQYVPERLSARLSTTQKPGGYEDNAGRQSGRPAMTHEVQTRKMRCVRNGQGRIAHEAGSVPDVFPGVPPVRPVSTQLTLSLRT